ncbi:MAG: glycosyltransferase family 4 protein [Victivallaceae bacterium]|nr:glycosyltransferase family 4 protein [Victivallaceae bacterium]
MTVGLAIMYFYDHGVTRRDFRDLALELKRRGHSVVVFAARWKSEKLPDVRHVRVRATGRDTSARLHSFESNLRRALRGFSIDCLVSFSRISGADFYYAGEHAISDEWKDKYGFLRFFMPRYLREYRLEKAVYCSRRAPKIWVLSPMQRNVIRSRFNVPAERIEVLCPGVSANIRRRTPAEIAERRAALCEKFGIDADETVCAMSGSDFAGRGVDRVIQSLSFLADDDLRKIRLIVVGKGNIAKIDSLARHCNVRDRVFFLEKSSVDWFFTAADLVLAPARRDLVDSAPLEALVCGTPVVVTAKYAFSDFVAGHGGIVIDEPFHCHALTRTMRYLLTSNHLEELKKEAAAFDPAVLHRRIPQMADRIGEFAK